MKRKYKFDEQYEDNFKKLKNYIKAKSCLQESIENCAYFFAYDDKEFHDILGDDYEKIATWVDDIKKAFTPDIKETFKSYWIYRYFVSKLEKKKAPKYQFLLNSIEKPPLSLNSLNLSDNCICKIVDSWRIEAEKGKYKDYEKIIPVLRVGEKGVIQNYKKQVLSKYLDSIRIWDRQEEIRQRKIIELCFEFLCDYVFTEIDFWEVYYDEKKLLGKWISIRLDNGLSIERNGVVFVEDPVPESIKKMISKIVGCGVEQGVCWHVDDAGSNIFEINYNRYSFYRCFYRLYSDIFGLKGADIRNLYKMDLWKEYYGVGTKISYDVIDSIKNWFAYFKNENFFYSILIELLIMILLGSKRNKDEQLYITRESKKGLVLRSNDNVRETLLWSIAEDEDASDIHKVKSYFAPLFEYKIEYKKYEYIKGIAFKNGKRSQSFDRLIDKIVKLEKDLPFFECYMLELQTGFFTAWRIYSIFFEILNLGKQNETLLETLLGEVIGLSKAISKIHNLELRLTICNQIEQSLHYAMKDSTYDIHKIISLIRESLLSEDVLQLQEKYDMLFRSLLYLFKDKNRWESMMWMRNCETKEVSFLLDQMKELSQNKNPYTYVQMKFDKLYEAGAKKDSFQWYREIWKAVKTDNSWVWNV